MTTLKTALANLCLILFYPMVGAPLAIVAFLLSFSLTGIYQIIAMVLATLYAAGVAMFALMIRGLE